MKCGILGGGNMGEALLQSFLEAHLFQADELHVTEALPERIVELKEKYKVSVSADQDSLISQDLIFLATKPQDLPTINFKLADGAIIVSLLAGVPTALLQKHFPNCRLVRTMPNLGLSVGQGMTGIYFLNREGFTETEIKLIRQCFRASGELLEVKKESAMDAITAISGSGPAYIFYFLEKFALCNQEFGFSPEEAELLARQTLQGAMEILRRHSDDEAHTWRKKVTSKGGTTEKAIEVLEASDFTKIFLKALKAAETRAAELGQGE
jgi:pyrroline-5-carboxylate reductase